MKSQRLPVDMDSIPTFPTFGKKQMDAPFRDSRVALSAFYFVFLQLGLTIFLSTAQAQQTFASNAPAPKVELLLRSQTDCPSNLVLVSDLLIAKGSDALLGSIMDVPLAPAPRLESEQVWTRSEIERALSLRGFAVETIRWQGAFECSVRRVPGPRPPKPSVPTVTPANITKTGQNQFASAPSVVQVANHQQPTSADAFSSDDPPALSFEPIDKTKFTSAFLKPGNVAQSERVAALAIENYLQTKTASIGRWNIRVEMPSEHAKLFSQKNRIISLAGGQPPWEGSQEFTFLMKGQNGEQAITLSANVELPDMVVAAVRPLSKGYVLKEADLVWIPMPRGASFGSEDCFSQSDDIVGQQLRRSMSTQQVIRLNEVGPPTIIHVGDLVGIGIVSGGVTVETNGRAVEAGSMDDLIQVEIQQHRKRVLARVTGERTVEVISNNAASNSQSNRKTAGKTNPSLSR